MGIKRAKIDHQPCSIFSETNNVNRGLLVEVWTKGIIWDRALGYKLIPLDQIARDTNEKEEQWHQLDMELILMDGEVAGTKNPTGHYILLDCRFELPFGEFNLNAIGQTLSYL